MICLKFKLHLFVTCHPVRICAQVWFKTEETVHSNFTLEIVLQIPEEEKDPVYKYFESMMTCARVREFNAKPPPQVSILPEIFNTPTSTVKEKKTVDDSPKTYFRTLNSHTKEGKEPKIGLVKNQSKPGEDIFCFLFPAHLLQCQICAVPFEVVLIDCHG